MVAGRQKLHFNFCLVNAARSISPKIFFVKKTCPELNIDIVIVVTETWLHESVIEGNQKIKDIEDSTNYKFIRRDRTSGRSGGGVAMRRKLLCREQRSHILNMKSLMHKCVVKDLRILRPGQAEEGSPDWFESIWRHSRKRHSPFPHRVLVSDPEIN